MAFTNPTRSDRHSVGQGSDPATPNTVPLSVFFLRLDRSEIGATTQPPELK